MLEHLSWFITDEALSKFVSSAAVYVLHYKAFIAVQRQVLVTLQADCPYRMLPSMHRRLVVNIPGSTLITFTRIWNL